MTPDRPVPGSPVDAARQLREAADRLVADWTSAASSMARAASGSQPRVPDLPAPPATMSAEQVQRLLDDLAARRTQVQALRDQLTGFDEQLGVLEATLLPVLEWTRAWARLDEAVAALWRLPADPAER